MQDEVCSPLQGTEQTGVLQTLPTDFREDQNVVPAWIMLPTWPMYGRCVLVLYFSYVLCNC